MNDQALYDKLVARTVKDGDCWTWTGATNQTRKYESSMRGEVYANGEYWLAHRAMWFAARGPIPEGLCVCHSCDNSLCLNPEHLWLGTHKQNMQDMAAKGRSSGTSMTHCKRGHPLSGDNLVQNLLTNKNPQRRCKICRTEYDRRTYKPSPPKPLLPKAERLARNAAVVEARKAGATTEELADRFKLSSARISQLCIAAGLRTVSRPPRSQSHTTSAEQK